MQGATPEGVTPVQRRGKDALTIGHGHAERETAASITKSAGLSLAEATHRV
jgi:hypothetical protein